MKRHSKKKTKPNTYERQIDFILFVRNNVEVLVYVQKGKKGRKADNDDRVEKKRPLCIIE